MQGTLNRRYCELRQDGRTITGVAVRYGDLATLPWGEERISPGAFTPIGDVIMNVQHRRDRPVARTPQTLTFSDTPDSLTLRAELPSTREADDLLANIRAGVLRGLSIEFRVSSERLDNDVLVIERGVLSGVGVVDRPAYPESLVAARAALTAPCDRAPERRRKWVI